VIGKHLLSLQAWKHSIAFHAQILARNTYHYLNCALDTGRRSNGLTQFTVWSATSFLNSTNRAITNIRETSARRRPTTIERANSERFFPIDNLYSLRACFGASTTISISTHPSTEQSTGRLPCRCSLHSTFPTYHPPFVRKTTSHYEAILLHQLPCPRPGSE
jgi:hypothetical protein